VVVQATPAGFTPEQSRLAAYQTLGHRRDSLCELLEAAAAAPGPATLARLSLVPIVRRGWSSASDALAEGDPAAARCRQVVRTMALEPVGADRPIWALDGTPWPRPAAGTSPERTYGRRTAPGIPQAGVGPAWEYGWLAEVPAPGTSWVLPLDGRRRGPTPGTPTAVGCALLRAALAGRPADAPRPVVAPDSGYAPVPLARARLAANLLARLRSNRSFCRAPGPYRGRGAPRKYGAVFKLGDPTTQGEADAGGTLRDPPYGRVRVEARQDLRAKGAADAPFTVARVRVGRLPRRAKPPAPLRLAWIGGAPPGDRLELWHRYSLRFTVAHGIRSLKHSLGRTTVRPTTPAAADRWTWLLAPAFWELWLAPGLVAEQRLPRERGLPPEQLTPGRVRRAGGGLLGQLGTPARSPKPRGKSPGRRPGQRPGPRPRHPVARRPPRPARSSPKRAA
jgi:hypothetical protein